MVHYLPCGTKFLWVLIFAIFSAQIFPAKNFSTVKIFQLKFFQLIIRTINHPRCYCNRMTKKSNPLYWFYIQCRVHKLYHCLFQQNKKVANSHKHFMPQSMLEKLQGLLGHITSTILVRISSSFLPAKHHTLSSSQAIANRGTPSVKQSL